MYVCVCVFVLYMHVYVCIYVRMYAYLYTYTLSTQPFIHNSKNWKASENNFFIYVLCMCINIHTAHNLLSKILKSGKLQKTNCIYVRLYLYNYTHSTQPFIKNSENRKAPENKLFIYVRFCVYKYTHSTQPFNHNYKNRKAQENKLFLWRFDRVINFFI